MHSKMLLLFKMKSDLLLIVSFFSNLHVKNVRIVTKSIRKISITLNQSRDKKVRNF